MQERDAIALNYLDPAVLATIAGLELRARLAVEGYFSGMHHSPHHGLSIEFAEHRVYTQGDDLRHIDWKVFGRTDKYYIKEYEQESNLHLMLVVDGSESMTFRSAAAAMSKYDYACTIAAAIAYLALQQQDAVGLTLFDERLTRFLRPSSSHPQWRTLAHELAVHRPSGETSVGRVCAELAERLHQQAMIVVISDLLDDVEVTIKGLKQLRYHRHEPIVWNVCDEAELTFPYTGPTMFVGLEAGGTLLTDPGGLRGRYLDELQRFQARLRSACGQAHVDYAIFNTAQSLGIALAGYLGTRNARLRARSSRVLGAG
ncbi:MAG: DUF58 domain-containing protein [Planctomycetes bacterium]|nr:DUF58 domain-containing protein [Planctomycetota bacterium]